MQLVVNEAHEGQMVFMVGREAWAVQQPPSNHPPPLMLPLIASWQEKTQQASIL